MTARIFLSSDHNPMYTWFCPLASIAWQRVVGFQPLILMVGPVDTWILQKTIETGADVVRLANVPGVSSSAMSQFCRLWAWQAPVVQPDDYMMVVDIDAWPCQREVFQPSGADMDAIYPNWMMPFFPMGYVGMRAALWRQVIGYASDSIEESVATVLATHPELQRRVASKVEDPLFNFDEAFVTERIRAYPGLYPARAREVSRVGGDLLNDRLDRIRWPSDPDPAGMIDAHLLRPGWTEENWPRLRPLYARLVPPADLAWADDYRAEWLQRQ